MKAAGVEQRIDALASKHFALFVLSLHCALRASRLGLRLAFGEIAQFVSNRICGHVTTIVAASYSTDNSTDSLDTTHTSA